jgi:N-acetylglucosaminyl-diphospho-decaprenol L-rhamnosyltransferase
VSSWTVITVTYNSLEHLIPERKGRLGERNYKWIVVDNSSTDGTVARAHEVADLVIESGGNLGFSHGNNIGLEAVDTDYVVFVNPDVTLVGDNWQQHLEETIERIGGLVAPQLLNVDGSEQANARGIPYLSAKVRNRARPDSDKGEEYARTGFEEPTFIGWAMGAALAGRTEDVRAIGAWDDSYFLYYEDHEIGLRAWREGLAVALDPRVRWIHDWQRATTGPSLWAWRAEFGSMKTFYSQFPELFRRRYGAGRRHAALERAGLSRLADHLWKPVGAGTAR